MNFKTKGSRSMITMDDIIREGHPTLREHAKPVALPLSQEDLELGKKMMEFLHHSQDPEIAEKHNLRAGVGLAAPQINISKQITAVHIPDEEGDIIFSDVLYNPTITRHSVKKCTLPSEGCLSVDREVEGYVPRPKRITVKYTNAHNQEVEVKFKGYEAIVIQHELDHLKGVMFYDHINKDNPFELDEDTRLIN